ncbi:monocarboxylate transporter 13-like isoform X2 [Mya arenaria]|uniref:monocarboxylate transporter 13-like isoform X2 n=1 Tax=Mya arenaria TaxID=6604 RepID=UPI0022E6B106|nr:monocarboxylate transporter 13-like isoform X2 [Mya arenaria]
MVEGSLDVKEVTISEMRDEINAKVMNGNGRRKESIASNDSLESVGNYIPTPPDGGWGWVVVFASLCCNIIVDGIAYSFGIFLPEFVEYFGESRSKVSLIGSLLCGTYLCAGPIVSGLTNKFGCRPVAMTGSLIATIAFVCARFSPNLDVLIVTYGVLGGFGFGMIYLPSIVSVGYYFEKKRAIATGIAVCGSGVGTFIFAPLTRYLLDNYDWKNAILIIAGIVFNGCVFGALMRPLEPVKKIKDPEIPRKKNMLDRLKEEAKKKRKRGFTSESSGIGQTDTTEFLDKLNQTKLRREQILQENESDIASLPSTYFEKDGRHFQRQDSRTSSATRPHIQKLSFSERGDISSHAGSPTRTPRITIDQAEFGSGSFRVGSESASPSNPSSPVRSSKSPTFENAGRKRISTASNDSAKGHETIGFPNGVHAHEVQPLIKLGGGGGGHKPNVAKELMARSGHIIHGGHPAGSHTLLSNSMRSITTKDYARPMYKKDIFYSGSIANINEFRSQPTMASYITSITSIPGDLGEVDQRGETACHRACACLPKPLVDVMSEMLDMSLLKNAGFMFICLGNIFAMIGFYVPYVFIVERAMLLGVDKTRASFLLSAIGITNTVGRIISGSLADLPSVNSLLLNNVSMLVAGVTIMLTPFCNSFASLMVAALMFGLMTSAFISLTSIILCELLGLGKLTNAFGLLSMGRGIAGIIGPPMAGAVFTATGNYDASFFLGGGLFLCGTMFHFVLFLPCFKVCLQKDDDEDITVTYKSDPESAAMPPRQEPERPERVEL